MALSIVNYHSRDNNLIYKDEEHLYFLDEINLTSVTQFINTILFPEFDENLSSKEIVEREKTKEDKYYGLNQQEIILTWETNRNLGIELHKLLDDYYNSITFTNMDKFIKEFNHFQNFEKDKIKGRLIPFRSEWRIYDEELKLGGTIDILYKVKNDVEEYYILYDYKRIEKLTKYSFKGEGGLTNATKNTPDCNFSHYSIQLMIYKYILEKNYNIKVKQLFLLLLHPNLNNYIQEEIFYYPYLMENIVKERIKELI